jgi:hypothetical protein
MKELNVMKNMTVMTGSALEFVGFIDGFAKGLQAINGKTMYCERTKQKVVVNKIITRELVAIGKDIKTGEDVRIRSIDVGREWKEVAERDK